MLRALHTAVRNNLQTVEKRAICIDAAGWRAALRNRPHFTPIGSFRDQYGAVFRAAGVTARELLKRGPAIAAWTVITC
jgi:hypothetical protein